MKRKSLVLLAQTIVVCAAVYVNQQSIQAQGVAPDGPGGNADWLPANKTGFGTSYTTASNVWFTLQGGRLSEVYYPRLDTPSVRNLDFVVTDGQSFAVKAQNSSTSRTRLVMDPNSLTYEIVNTDTANLAAHHYLRHGSFPRDAAHQCQVYLTERPAIPALRGLPTTAQQPVR